MTYDLERMLGLDTKEALIFRILNAESKRISDIQKEIGNKIPRTTLIRVLSKLHKRKLISKHKFSSRRGGWVREDLKAVLKPAEDFLTGREGAAISHKENEVIVYRGREEMLKLADKAQEFKKGEKIYWILPSNIWEAWNSAGLHKRVIWLNQFLQKKSVIVDTIVADNFLAEDLKFGGEDMIRGYLNRPAIVHTLPEEYLRFSSDIMIFRNRVSIMNWKDEMAVEIRNRDLVNLFRGIIGYLRTCSKNINLHTEAEKLLGTL